MLVASSIFSEECFECFYCLSICVFSFFYFYFSINTIRIYIYRWEAFRGVCEIVKTSVADTPSPPYIYIHLPIPLSCQCEINSQRSKETRPLPPTCYAPSQWTLRGWMCAPPYPAAGGVCFTGLCDAGPGRIRFHRYKSFRFNPITQSEWSGLRAST